MKKSYVLFSIFFLLVLFIIPLIPNFVLGVVTNSTYSIFNATNTTVFNWTSSNITIGFYNDTIQMNINNVTTGLYPDYSQHSGEITHYGDTTWGICFPGWVSSNYNISFVVQNQTGFYTNYTSLLNNSNVEDFILSIHPSCPPGKYSGYFRVTRVGNESDKVDVITTVNLPISANNTLNTTYNTAYFKGTMAVNYSYHSYYFNTSEIPENMTGLTIKLSQLSDDVDLFLFDNSGNLQGKSIERGTTEEKMIDVDLPPSWAMWEIRVYGNVSSSYRGDVYFSTLNTSLSSLNLGDLDANGTNSSEFTLSNEDDKVLSNVYGYSEIYHLDTWSFKNTSQDFTNFLVPSFTKKIKVKIEWTDEPGKNITDWDLYLRDSSGNFIGNSTNKFFNANKTNATREEYVVFSGPFNNTNEGFWNISVRNQTNSSIPLSYYNVTAYIWVNESNWISTNYTTFTFNSSGLTNDSYIARINLTIPETQVLDGRYEGFLKYNSSDGWNSILPILFNVSAGTLIINNSLSTYTARVKDNIGFNRLGTSALITRVIFNNTGSFPVWYINETNYTASKDSNSNVTFTVDWPQNPINPRSSDIINITISINTTLTGNDVGIYTGWIFFNTTNTTLNSSSYPYKNLNITLEVNLTDKLEVQVESVNTTFGNQSIVNPSNIENITFVTKVYLINGSQLGDTSDAGYVQPLYVENFTSASLVETNVSTTYTLTNITQKESPGTPTLLCSGGKCYVNATNPTGIIGGRYRASIGVQWNTSESLLIGNGSYLSIFVNEAGLHMSTNATGCSFGPSSCNPSFSIANGSSNARTFFINVSNFGPLAASSATINFSENCGGYSVAVTDRSGCGDPSSQSGTLFTISPAAYSRSCLVWWTITPGSSAASACKGYILGNPTNKWFDNISVTITITASTTTTTTTATATTAPSATTTAGTTTTTTVPAAYLEITSYPSTVTLEQGNSTTEWIKVKNVNKTISQSVTLSILSLNTSWYSIPSPTVTIPANGTNSYLVKFNVSIDAEVGDYNGKFNASSRYGSVLKSFVLTVTPSAETKRQINFSISEYQSQLTLLETQINDTKDKGYNTSEADKKFSELKNKINAAINYRNNGDYKSAYQTFITIDNLLNETRTALNLATLPKTGIGFGDWWGWGKWIIIGVAGVAAGFLGYLFWPTPGYHPEKGFAPQPKIEVRSRFKDRLEKLRERWNKIREKKEKTKYIPPSV